MVIDNDSAYGVFSGSGLGAAWGTPQRRVNQWGVRRAPPPPVAAPLLDTRSLSPFSRPAWPGARLIMPGAKTATTNLVKSDCPGCNRSLPSPGLPAGGLVGAGAAAKAREIALAAVMAQKAAFLPKPHYNGFGDQGDGNDSYAGFGDNEDYCDKTYPRGVSAQVDKWNSKCKIGGSLTNPGAYAHPKTDLGRDARGLPAGDGILASALNVGKKATTAITGGVTALVGGKKPSAGGKTGPGGVPSGGGIMSSPYFMPVALAAAAGVAFFIWKRR